MLTAQEKPYLFICADLSNSSGKENEVNDTQILLLIAISNHSFI
jgi:hypothetical protein